MIGETVPNLRQAPLYPSSKGGDGFFLPLICPVKIPHQQVKGFYIPIYNSEFLQYHVQWNIGSHIADSVSSGSSEGMLDPFPQCCITVGLPKGLELIAPLLKRQPPWPFPQ